MSDRLQELLAMLRTDPIESKPKSKIRAGKRARNPPASVDASIDLELAEQPGMIERYVLTASL